MKTNEEVLQVYEEYLPIFQKLEGFLAINEENLLGRWYGNLSEKAIKWYPSLPDPSWRRLNFREFLELYGLI